MVIRMSLRVWDCILAARTFLASSAITLSRRVDANGTIHVNSGSPVKFTLISMFELKLHRNVTC